MLNFTANTITPRLAFVQEKSRQAIRFLLRMPASANTPTIPAHFPLAAGINSADFHRHYIEAHQRQKNHVQQGIFNAWYFYVAPTLIGMVPGKLYADLLHPLTADDMVIWWIPTLLTQLVITPLLMRYRRIHKRHKRHQIFYTAALEACLQEEARREH